MKTTASAAAHLTTWLASLCFLVITSLTPVPAHAQDETVDFDYFYDNLAEHGDWIEVEGYGYCFRPFVAYDKPDWQPYAEGSWAETEGGWTWVSTEPFGWATYHYGRWMIVDNFWVWVPGYEWAPAWVSWRENDEYVGWAPLPPEAHWSNDRGFGANVDIVFDIGPRYYNFIPIRFFGEPNCRPHLISREHNHTYISETVNITHIHYRESPLRLSRIFVGGPRYDFLERHSDHDIRRLKLTQHRYRDQDGPDGRRNRIENDRFSVFAPSITRREGQERQIAPREVKMRTTRDKVDRGWRGIEESQVTQIRQRLSDQERERPERERRRNEERERDGNRDGDRNRTPSGPDRAGLPPGMVDPRQPEQDGRERNRDGRGPSSQDMKEKDRDGDRGPGGAPGSNPQRATPMPGQETGRDRDGQRRPDRDGDRGPAGAPGSNPQRGAPTPGQEGERGERSMPPSTEQRERERSGKPDESMPPGRQRPGTPPDESNRGPAPETKRPDGRRDMPSTPGNQPAPGAERERGPQSRPDQPREGRPPGQSEEQKPQQRPDKPEQTREMRPAVPEQRREQPQQRGNDGDKEGRERQKREGEARPATPPQENRKQESPPQARERKERPDSPPRQEQPKQVERPKPQEQPEQRRERPPQAERREQPEQRRAEAPRPQPQQQPQERKAEPREGGGKKEKGDGEDRKKKD